MVHFVSPNPPTSNGKRLPVPDILGVVLSEDPTQTAETAEIVNGLTWDYAQAGDNAEAVIGHTVEIKRSERRASEAIIEAGKHLLATQELLPHGTWLDWLNVEFKMSQRTAYNMIGIAKRFGDKVATVASLQPSVLYLLAGDSVPETARKEVIQRAAAGETVTKATAKAVIEEHKPKERFYLSNDDVPAELRAAGWEVRSKDIDAWWFVNTADGGGMETAIVRSRSQFDELCRMLLAKLEQKRRMAAQVKTAPAPVVVDMEPEPEPDNGQPTHEMLVAKFTIWKWLVEQCGPADFKGMVELAEALHYQEASHPLWFKMYPKGADIDDVFWALETCIDEAAGLVPEYASGQTAGYMPTANLKAAIIYWLREKYPDYYGQVAALQCMIADPMHDEDMQRMEPTLPTPYRKDDLLVAMMQASAYLDSLRDDDEPEEADTSIPRIPNPNWEAGRQPDPEPEHDLDCYDDTLARPVARRMNRLHTLKVRFQETIDLFPEFGVLTGHYVDTNPAKRALRQLIEVLDGEMDALAASAKGGAEG